MTQYVGLDVSLKETKLHVLDEAGQRVWRGRCATEPAAIAAAVRRYAPTAVRIGLETGPLTTWLWTALTAAGLPMVCLDARHAKKALDMKVNKTDANDAEGLAHLVRAGWYREVRVKSRSAMLAKALLGARSQLLSMSAADPDRAQNSGRPHPRTPIMRRLDADRGDNPAPGIQCYIEKIVDE
jgi:transposase